MGIMPRRIAILVLTALLGSTAAAIGAESNAHYAVLTPDAFLKTWLVLGPVSIAEDAKAAGDAEAQKRAFATDLLLSCGGEARARAAAPATCKISGRTYQFKAIQSQADTVDLGALLGGKDHAVAYALAEIESKRAATVVAGLGSDDGVKVWLNGKLVHDHWASRQVRVDEDLLSLSLRPGKNQLLLKVYNGTGGWGFTLRPLGQAGLDGILWQAAKAGDVERLRAALVPGQSMQVDAVKSGLTAWQAAKVFGRAEAAQFLASAGADTKRPIPPPEMVVDAMLTAAIPERSSGLGVLVSRDGQTVFEKGYGYANAGDRVPVTPETKFRIGSITKQFTAAAILRLEEQGKLSVSDPLSKYIPDFPRGSEVTLRHLLTHTSGLHSYTDRPDFAERSMLPTTTEKMLQTIRAEPYDFDPGTRWSYCNSGYFLLGYLVEKVSGQPYAEFMRTQFFEPLGMKDTGVHTADAVLDNEATGYAQSGAELKKAPNWNMAGAGGAGALYSTVRDLARWNDALFGGKVLSAASLKAAWSPLSNATPPVPSDSGYGFGWQVGKLRGLQEIGHGGGLPGFLSQLSRYPSERVTVVVLGNSAPPIGGAEPAVVAREIAEVFLGGRMEARPSATAIALAPSHLERFVGRYDYGGPVLSVTREGGRLFAQLGMQPRFEVFPRSASQFFWKVVDADIEFVSDASGRVVKAIHRQNGSTIEAPRVD